MSALVFQPVYNRESEVRFGNTSVLTQSSEQAVPVHPRHRSADKTRSRPVVQEDRIVQR